MKRIICLIALMLCVSSFVACKQSEIKDDKFKNKSSEKISSITTTPKLDNSKDVTDFNDNIYEDTLKGIFGGIEFKDVQKKLGTPIKKLIKTDYERWYYNEGVEIDIVNQNDASYALFNYVYISPKSNIKTPKNIGIGSSKDEVMKAYGHNVNYEQTNNDNIVIGLGDIIFVTKSDKVESIFISTGAFTQDEGKN